MRRNILFFFLAIAISLVVAPYFGVWYDRLDPQYGGWITSKEDAVIFAGFVLAYTFFIPFVFGLFTVSNRNKWIVWLASPVLLIYAGYDWRLLYVPVTLGLTGFALAKLLRFIISKFHHPNPPMVIK